MKLSVKEISLVAMFAALTAVAAIVSRIFVIVLPFAQVPFSIVPFVVLLTGMVLGARLGALSMVVYVVMGLIGVPVFEKPPFGGPAYILQPTFGFLLGFILGAYVTGKITEKAEPGILRYLIASLAGIATIYLLGLPYLYGILNFYLGKSVPVLTVIKIGFAPFIGLDILKGVLASILSVAVLKRVNAAVGIRD